MSQAFSSPLPVPADIIYDFAAARRHMVQGQLMPNGVGDPRILAAMGAIERELFVPSSLVGVAYLDSDVPLVNYRTLMQPLVLARLIQAADIDADDTVLDLAPATGYSTVILSALAATVIAIEPDALLCKAATDIVARSVPAKAKILLGAPEEGHAAQAPFDAILINGAVDAVPQALFAQLAEGGRLLAVVHVASPIGLSHAGQARLYRKKGGVLTETTLFDANIALAPGFSLPQAFSF